MAQITEYMSYTIWFTDQAEYNFALGVAENMQIKLSPRNAATLFGIPYPSPPQNPQLASKGMMFYFPNIPETSINVTLAESNPIFLDTFTNNVLVITTAGVPAGIWPKGPDILLQWVGLVTLVVPVEETEDIPTIPQRRWFTGFEWVALQELAGVQGLEIQFSRVGSRTIDGFGFSYRGTSSITCNHQTDAFRTFALFQPKRSWERIYVRLRKVGTTNFVFWAARGSGEQGAHLTFNGLTIGVYNRTGFGTGTLEGSVVIELDTWYRLDMIMELQTGMGTTAIFQLYVNGVLAVSFSKSDNTGINNATHHQRSTIGNVGNVSTDHEIEIDIDDWSNMDWPVDGMGNLSLLSVDWFVGSHGYKHRSISVSTTWTGNTETVNQGNAPINSVPTTLTSTTSAAQIEGLTDLADIETMNTQNTSGISLGQISATIGQISTSSNDGKLGYKIAGGGAVLITIDETSGFLSTAIAYLPSGLILPVEITPFSIIREKSADTNLVTNNSLVSVSENLGVWGPEDAEQGLINTEDWPNRFMLHNSRYGNTGWGNVGSIPLAPVIAMGGTYTGNGTIQSIALPAPCHFLWITSNSTGGGVRAFGAGIQGCTNATATVNAGLRIWADDTGQFFFTIHGANANLNQNAVVYQYIAFCDPGMRFNLCGAYLHSSTGVQPKANPLVNENFLAQAAFIQRESVSAVDNGIGLSFGLGGVGTLLTGTFQNPWVDFSPGNINTYNNVHNVNSVQFNYSLWRTTEDCAGVMCQIFSYVGNGVASRVINCSPLSGRFPLFALVVPRANATGAFRTPSQTGSNSVNTNGTGGLITAGITAGGIDTITVGSTLNSNGVTYDCFVIPGSSTAWENGTFIASYCLPPLGPWEPPGDPIGNIIIMSEGGLSLGAAATQTTILKDISGIYTIVPGKTNDTLINRNESPIEDQIVKIPDPIFKTGYIGG